MSITALEQGFARCKNCRKLSKIPQMNDDEKAFCSRCQTKLELRLPNSINNTWALIITSFILLIPANIYPVMTIIDLGIATPDTIMSGIIQLWVDGLQPIATIVFFASILVPFFKLISLTIILLIIQNKWAVNPAQCTTLYRFITLIGRWSMIDLFVLAILVTLVDLGRIALVIPGPAATAFATVVVLTIVAAKTFDPRIIWDSYAQLKIPEKNETPSQPTTE